MSHWRKSQASIALHSITACHADNCVMCVCACVSLRRSLHDFGLKLGRHTHRVNHPPFMECFGLAASFSAFICNALTHPPVVAKAMAPKGVTASGSAVQLAAATDSASQPASQLPSQPAAAAGGTAPSATLPLCELTKRSAQFGSWRVVVRQAKVDTPVLGP
jgi:hypothetical protein